VNVLRVRRTFKKPDARARQVRKTDSVEGGTWSRRLEWESYSCKRVTNGLGPFGDSSLAMVPTARGCEEEEAPTKYAFSTLALTSSRRQPYCLLLAIHLRRRMAKRRQHERQPRLR
jgi:hypothetical protein